MKVILKTYVPKEKEIEIKVKANAKLKDVIKNVKMKSPDDYIILVNSISVKNLEKRLKENSKIVILPRLLGG